MSPQRHLQIGRALAPLRDEGAVIVGLDMTSHNLGEGPTPRVVAGAADFDDGLTDAATSPAARRDALLAAWDEAPGAPLSYPREEQLLPMMVAAEAPGPTPAGGFIPSASGARSPCPDTGSGRA